MQQGKNWFDEAKLWLLIHRELYALIGHGEWIMKRDSIPEEDYTALSEKWDTEESPAENRCRIAAGYGMKYAVFTTRHHDGFSLFCTQLDSFNSVCVPSANDCMEDFVHACNFLL